MAARLVRRQRSWKVGMSSQAMPSVSRKPVRFRNRGPNSSSSPSSFCPSGVSVVPSGASVSGATGEKSPQRVELSTDSAECCESRRWAASSLAERRVTGLSGKRKSQPRMMSTRGSVREYSRGALAGRASAGVGGSSGMMPGVEASCVHVWAWCARLY